MNGLGERIILDVSASILKPSSEACSIILSLKPFKRIHLQFQSLAEKCLSGKIQNCQDNFVQKSNSQEIIMTVYKAEEMNSIMSAYSIQPMSYRVLSPAATGCQGRVTGCVCVCVWGGGGGGKRCVCMCV